MFVSYCFLFNQIPAFYLKKIRGCACFWAHPLTLQVAVLRDGIKAGTVLMHVGQVAMAHDTGIWMLGLQTLQQVDQFPLLGLGAGVADIALRIQSAFVAHAQGVLVVAHGMGAYQLFVARLVDHAVTGYVVVIAGKAEAGGVVVDECLHAVMLVTACGTTMNNNQINLSHIRSNQIIDVS